MKNVLAIVALLSTGTPFVSAAMNAGDVGPVPNAYGPGSEATSLREAKPGMNLAGANLISSEDEVASEKHEVSDVI
jgi:hypothetical protein